PARCPRTRRRQDAQSAASRSRAGDRGEGAPAPPALAPRALRANLRPTYRQGRPHRRLAVKPGRLALLTFRHREVVRSIPWHVRSGPAPKADLAAAPEVPLLGTCGASCVGQVDGADVADVSAGVAKSVYALDLKSSPCKGLRVRAPPPAHYRSD